MLDWREPMKPEPGQPNVGSALQVRYRLRGGQCGVSWSGC